MKKCQTAAAALAAALGMVMALGPTGPAGAVPVQNAPVQKAPATKVDGTSSSRPIPGLASCPGGAKGTLSMAEDHGGPYTQNYNPFTGSIAADTQSFVYETLLQFSLSNSTYVQPWLASGYKWSDGGRTLTFQLRRGITWSDGKPFTSADVVFTFNLIKKNPSTNLKGIFFSTISAQGKYGVKMTFAAPEYSQLFYIGTQYIVPEHIWASIANPAKALNNKPVGTGPYLLSKLSASDAVYTPNPHYWQKGLPCIATVTVPAYYSNTTADLAMEEGDGDWGGLFVAGMRAYSSKPGHKYWNPPTGVVALYPNLTEAPTNSLALRQAISLALNRPEVEQLGEQGEETPVSNATAVILPRDKAELAPQYANDNFRQNVGKAKSVLQKAGYTYRGGKLIGPDHKVVTLQIGAPAAFSDWVAAAQEVARELKALGISATADPVENTTYFTDLSLGKFQLAMDAGTLGPSSFYQYDGWMASANSAPIGKVAPSNLERFNDARANSLINSYLGTDNRATQQKDMAGLEGIMVNDLPVIPLYYATEWGLYVDTNIKGWPSPSHPYQITSPYDTPMNEVVLLHLTWKG